MEMPKEQRVDASCKENIVKGKVESAHSNQEGKCKLRALNASLIGISPSLLFKISLFPALSPQSARLGMEE